MRTILLLITLLTGLRAADPAAETHLAFPHAFRGIWTAIAFYDTAKHGLPVKTSELVIAEKPEEQIAIMHVRLTTVTFLDKQPAEATGIRTKHDPSTNLYTELAFVVQGTAYVFTRSDGRPIWLFQKFELDADGKAQEVLRGMARWDGVR